MWMQMLVYFTKSVTQNVKCKIPKKGDLLQKKESREVAGLFFFADGLSVFV